jgi:hypothetical protein
MTVAAQNIAAAYPKAAPIAEAIVRVALHVGAHPYDLANLIGFESGWTFSPSVVNAVGATGLIQFYPKLTKQLLGVSTHELAKMDAVEQMEWVQTYLDKKRRGRELDTVQKLYMSVFYPAAMRWDLDDSFPARVAEQNNGISTPREYIAEALRYAKLPTSESGAPAIEDLVQPAIQIPSLPSMPTMPKIPDSSWSFPSFPSMTDLKSAWRNLGPTGTWENKTSATVRLVSTSDDQIYDPGAVPAGEYSVWVQQPSNSYYLPVKVSVDANKSYFLVINNRKWQWRERT